MAFIVGSVIIGAGAAIAGGAIGAKGAKDAAGIAAAGSDKEIQYLTESRDISRSDQAPYREAGYAALDKLGGMTGLLESGGSFGRGGAPGGSQGGALSSEGSPWGDSPWSLGWENDQYTASLADGTKNYWDGSNWQSSRTSSYGGGGGRREQGPIFSRAVGGPLYNVNELGPESVYSNGSYTRNGNPQTLPPDPTGYVHPNIQGRAIGGQIKPQAGSYGPMNVANPTGFVNTPGQQLPGGTPTGGALPGATGQPQVDGPQENQYNFTTDPGYNFRFDEGQRALERGAAARGGLLSGGFARKAIRYGQDYATNEFSNIYNRISNIAGLGQVSAQSGGNQAIAAGQGMGAAASDRAITSAYGQQGAANAWATGINDIGGMDWDKIMSGGGKYRADDAHLG